MVVAKWSGQSLLGRAAALRPRAPIHVGRHAADTLPRGEPGRLCAVRAGEHASQAVNVGSAPDSPVDFRLDADPT